MRLLALRKIKPLIKIMAGLRNASNHSTKAAPKYVPLKDISKSHVVDLRSDTVTQPTDLMRKAMLEAQVGDDVYGEDPTVRLLEERVARILNKEAALFVVSGTMGNLVSVMAHCPERGTEVIVGNRSHIYRFEQGGLAQIGGLTGCFLPNEENGSIDLKTIEASIRPLDDHCPITGLICIENTHSSCGGRVLPLSYLQELQALAKKHNLPIHMDGSRIFNAATHLKVEVSEISKYCDSLNICFSKGLGAPVGSAIAGTKEFIRRARRIRKVLGGGCRQVGVLAAPALVSLNTMVTRLEDDHQRTKKLAIAINQENSPLINVTMESVESNILLVNVDEVQVTGDWLTERMENVTEDEISALGGAVTVGCHPFSYGKVRFVFHKDINDNDLDKTIKKFQYVIKETNCTE